MEAARYFTRLLQFDERHLQLMVSILRGAFFIIHPAVHHVQPSPIQVIANQPAWLLDYKSRGYGTVVPQRLYRDAQSHPNVPLNMPIFFAHSELGTLGLRLAQAREGNIEGLLDGRAPALVGDCNTTYIRIQVSVSRVVHCVAIVWMISPSSGLDITNGRARLRPGKHRQRKILLPSKHWQNASQTRSADS
jgi:hypothetical protein